MNKLLPLFCLFVSVQVNAANQNQQDEPGFFDSIVNKVSGWFAEEPTEDEKAKEEKAKEEKAANGTAQSSAEQMKEDAVKKAIAVAEQAAQSPEVQNAASESKDVASALFGSLKTAAKDVALQTAGQMATDQIQQSTAQWREQLDSLIEDKSCDTQQQCKVVGVGHLPCGGPSIYLVYSTKNAGGKQVQSVANLITEQERKLHQELGTMGICKATPQIQAQCVNNRCVEVGGQPTAQ